MRPRSTFWCWVFERVVIVKVDDTEGFMTARVRALPMPDDSSRETEALTLSIVEMGSKFVGLIQNERHSAQELARMFTTHEDPLRLAYMVASIMNLEGTREQALLEAPTRVEALRLVHGWLSHEVEVLNLRNKITEDARGEMSKEQRDYILRQQKRAIENELGEKNDDKAEVESLREKLTKADLPDDVRKEAERELGRLEKMNPQQPEHNVIRTWLEYVIELPWKTRSEDNLDIARARQVLDEDHFGITKVKERILEQLAVLKLNPEAKAPILCFVGAPGVGKTSLGQSIARAIGRKFERMSLGGLHDEAELRGHRRTYIGAMPGRLIQAMRRAGANNPVLMLDEIDKLGRDFRGDPAAALLEVLDPEQNKAFRDNYLDLPFDLSKVLFVTTANSLDTIPAPLLDRMEIIRLSGYSEEEKAQIARRYLLPRQLAHAGLTAEQCNITEEALLKIIASYTREAGVRRLEQTLGRVIRKVALKFAENVTDAVTVKGEDVAEMLGPEPITPEMARRELPAGVATGLAWTETGGDVLYIEATLAAERQGADDYRPARRGDAGIGENGAQFRVGARRGTGHQSGVVPELGAAYSRAGGSDSERWSVGGRDDDDGAGVHLLGRSGAAGYGDDGRDYAYRLGSADRRFERKSAGGAARGIEARDRASRQSEGFARPA